MLYPIVIEPGTDTTAYGVVVPDLPGCFSAGDTLPEAIQNARAAIVLHAESLLANDEALPEPQVPHPDMRKACYRGWFWHLVDVPLDNLRGRPVRINITVPRLLLKQVDTRARADGKSRSAWLADAASEALRRG